MGSHVNDRACVYCIKCLVNNKVYIGQTSRSISRMQEHIYALRGGKHRNKELQRDYNEYGESQFEYSVLDYCSDQATMDALEKSYISNARADCGCYNVFSGGRTGFDVTDEFRKKVSVGNKGKIVGPQTRAKMAENARKQWNNPEYSETMRNSARRQWTDEEYRKIMYDTHIHNPTACRHILDPDSVIRARSDYANGVDIQTLADRNGVAYSTMRNAIVGHSWKYVEENQ